MPVLWGFLFGMALRRWGVIGLFTWIFGTALVGELVRANISRTVGNLPEIVFVVGLFTWAIWRPTESEAKLGFLRALRLLILLCMLATGAVGLVVFILQDLRFSSSTRLTWLLLGISGSCGLALFAFRNWLDRDLRRSVAD